MAKEVSKVVKLQVKGGAANPSPPVGPALGAAGVNIMEFCKQFNARTQDKPGKICPVQITVYKDKSFDFVVKTPPAAIQLLDIAKLKSGSLDKDKQPPARMETKKATDMKISSTGSTELAGVGDNKGFEQPTESELINKPGYGAKKKLGGIMRKGGQVRKKRKK